MKVRFLSLELRSKLAVGGMTIALSRNICRRGENTTRIRVGGGPQSLGGGPQGLAGGPQSLGGGPQSPQSLAGGVHNFDQHQGASSRLDFPSVNIFCLGGNI